MGYIVHGVAKSQTRLKRHNTHKCYSKEVLTRLSLSAPIPKVHGVARVGHNLATKPPNRTVAGTWCGLFFLLHYSY